MTAEDSPWYVQLLVSAAVLIGVALLVAGIVTAVSFKAVDVAGLTAPQTSTRETVLIPTPTESAVSPGGGKHSATRKPPQSPGSTGHTKSSRNEAITLSASPLQVSALDHINLTGSYAAPDGTTLQVQREESPGLWVDFPVTTTVTGGTYSTYIQTSHVGTNQLRMTDPSTGAVSNVVSVQVG